MMARYKETDPAALDATQKKIWDEIAAGPRGSVPAPLQIWLKSPELASRAQKLGEFARYSTSLPPRLSELAILCTARFWTSQYEWYYHEGLARQSGLADDIIAAIAAQRMPDFVQEDERTVYDFSLALLRDRAVDDATFARARALFGERGVVDLVAILGYYGLISMTLNVYDVPVPGGGKPPLAP
jgi:4-carboxymuconolactone decarboxylase